MRGSLSQPFCSAGANHSSTQVAGGRNGSALGGSSSAAPMPATISSNPATSHGARMHHQRAHTTGARPPPETGGPLSPAVLPAYDPLG